MSLLGRRGRDVVTGFSGTITGEVQYITGCNQLLLTPLVGDDGRPIDPQWFDEQRVELDGTDSVVLKGPGYGPDKVPPTR